MALIAAERQEIYRTKRNTSGYSGERRLIAWIRTSAAQEKQNRKIFELYLRAWNTQQSIADVLGVAQKTISNVISNNAKIDESTKDFKPLLYNIWNTNKQDNNTGSHFGSFPLVFMKNLLHYHPAYKSVTYPVI